MTTKNFQNAHESSNWTSFNITLTNNQPAEKLRRLDGFELPFERMSNQPCKRGDTWRFLLKRVPHLNIFLPTITSLPWCSHRCLPCMERSYLLSYLKKKYWILFRANDLDSCYSLWRQSESYLCRSWLHQIRTRWPSMIRLCALPSPIQSLRMSQRHLIRPNQVFPRTLAS